MANVVRIVLLHLLLVPWVVAQGRFTNPAGADDTAGSGARVYTINSLVQISWTEIEDPAYSILSLGLARTDKPDIRWLISNQAGLPTTYNWTVTTFDLSYDNSTLFELLIVNGTQADGDAFGMRFNSATFGIAAESSQTKSSSSSSPTPSSTNVLPPSTTSTTTPVVTASASSSPIASSAPKSSSSLSTGAKVGLGIGTPLAFIVGLAIAGFVFRSRRRPGANRLSAYALGNTMDGNPPPAYLNAKKSQALSELETPHGNNSRAELG